MWSTVDRSIGTALLMSLLVVCGCGNSTSVPAPPGYAAHTVAPEKSAGVAAVAVLSPTVLDASGLVTSIEIATSVEPFMDLLQEPAAQAIAVVGGRGEQSLALGWTAKPCNDHPIILVEGEAERLEITVHRGPEPEGVECTADLQLSGVVVQLRAPVNPATVEASVKDGVPTR